MFQNDRQITLPSTCEIFFKSKPESRSLRVVVITGNEKKFEEFRKQLGDGYGMEIQQWLPLDGANLADEPTLTETCMQIMGAQRFTPHFILREETSLLGVKDNENLTHLSLESLAKRQLESVLHTSKLKIYKPQWVSISQETSILSEEKKLSGFTFRQYEKRSYGYIKRQTDAIESKQGFGWDALFVNAATNLTNEEFFDGYGKKSARQHTISDFIETYLRYKALVTLKHHKFTLQRPIDFGQNFFHLTEFITQEKHLSNPFIGDWGVEKLRNAMINEGIFIKAAWSRPVKNYFSPPFSGLPLTAKKDDAEETIFMTHDMLHHLVCDLICDNEPSKEHFNVYNAWRMTSEACTLVLADMLYADGLIKSGVDKTCVDKRIYPLFEAIKSVQNLPEPNQMSNDDKIKFIKKLLFANVRYALLGDDSEWQTLLTPTDGLLSPENFKCLEAYKNHFGKFFIGDNAWTVANFEHMHKRSKPLHEWVASVGKETFRQSNIPLLSDACNQLTASGIDLSEYKNVVNAVFNLIFETKIRPHLEKEHVNFEDNATVQSRAFRRFLIGQVSVFSRYPTPLNLGDIKRNIFARLQNDMPFLSEEQDDIRLLVEQYILGIEGLRLMSREEALNAIDCSSVFPAFYISYPDMQKKYGTIEKCVEACVEKYAPSIASVVSPKVSGSASAFFAEKSGLERVNQDGQSSHIVMETWV